MKQRRRAFTMVELLVTLAIIFLLMSLLFVALRGIRSSANRMDTSNSLRNMMQGYIAYTTDNEQQLMPGYLDTTKLRELGVNARLKSSGDLINDPADPMSWADPNDASSYCWRLAPYIDNQWDAYYKDYRHPGLNARMEDEYYYGVIGPASADEAADPSMGIGLVPSIGLNSIFMGGDNRHGGSAVTDLNPWDNPYNKIAATRVSEVKNPSTIVVFAPTVFWDQDELNSTFASFPVDPPIDDVQFGYVELRPPMLGYDYDSSQVIDVQWRMPVDADDPDADTHLPYLPLYEGDFDAGGGAPIVRWGDNIVPIGHLDGSVSTENMDRLSLDFAIWNPF